MDAIQILFSIFGFVVLVFGMSFVLANILVYPLSPFFNKDNNKKREENEIN